MDRALAGTMTGTVDPKALNYSLAAREKSLQPPNTDDIFSREGTLVKQTTRKNRRGSP
jgi:hypothetical protein